MDVIARRANDAFHHVQPRFGRGQKYHNVPVAHIAIGKQGPGPRTLGGKLNPVHEDVIADQQCVFHRAGGDFERLHHKSDDEQTSHEYRCQRGEKLDRRLLRFLFHIAVFGLVFFFRQYAFHASSFPQSRIVLKRPLLQGQAEKFLVYQPQGAVPPCDLKQMCQPIGEVIKPAAERRSRVPIPCFYRPVDHQRPPDNVFPRDESPEPAVLAVVAVVAHHKIVSLWDDELAVFYQFPHFQPPLSLQPDRRNVEARKVVAEHIVRRVQKAHVGFLQRLAVNPHLLIDQAQLVSRQPNHTLDEMLLRIDRIVKDDNVAARNLLVRHHTIAQTRSAVAELVHQQIVAYKKRVHHRFRRNLKSLHHKRDYKHSDHYCACQRLQRANQIRSRRLNSAIV